MPDYLECSHGHRVPYDPELIRTLCPHCPEDAPPLSPSDAVDFQPEFRPIANGRWAASGGVWAVHGDTQEAALEEFRRTQVLHREIGRRLMPPYESPDGMAAVLPPWRKPTTLGRLAALEKVVADLRRRLESLEIRTGNPDDD